MRHVLFVAGLSFAMLAAPRESAAQTPMGKTNANYPACTTRKALDELMDLGDDKAAVVAFMKDMTNGCVFLKANVKVYLGNDKGLSHIKIRLPGETQWLYTLTDAVTQVP
jgi:hypothetical protein